MTIKPSPRDRIRGLKRRDVIVGVIIVVAIIDAVLLGFIHARYIRERGLDIRPRHPAVAKPAPP